ncbi:ABC transporter permease [Mesoplasma seiffertii]|uniref:ABC transporter permease n=1 Tax=Mesoplasma seiffertii TaxID=28224 RepID=UPI00047B3F43|nr:ABC transporter permease [Mesoplasma seiffertii]
MSKNIDKNFEKRNETIRGWFKGLGHAIKIEIESRILMSWKRIIKFIGIGVVPIIYGITCVLAFWNPIEGIGRAPIAIMNNDHNIILVTSFEEEETSSFATSSKYHLKMGALNYSNGSAPIGSHGETVEDLNKLVYNLQNGKDFEGNSTPAGVELVLNNGLKLKTKANKTIKYEVTSSWEIIKSKLLPKTDKTISDQDYLFSAPKIADKMALTNIRYIDNNQEITNQWKGTKYYAQLKIKENYLANLIGYAGTLLYQAGATDDEIANNLNKTLAEWVAEMKNNQIDIWTTFERNFIFGYYMSTFNTFAEGMIIKAIPSVLTSLVGTNLLNTLSTSGDILNLALADAGNTSVVNEFDNYQKYVAMNVPNLPDLGTSEQRQKFEKYTIFGDVDENGKLRSSAKGGKLINSINELTDIGKWLLENTKVLDALGIISGNSQFPQFIKTLIINIIEAGIKEDAPHINQVLYNALVGQTDKTEETILSSVIKKIAKLLGLDNSLKDIEKFLNNLGTFNNTLVDPIMNQQQFIKNADQSVLKNSDVLLGATSVSQLPNKLKIFFNDKLLGGFTPEEIVQVEIQGENNGLYGIGLGIFFLVIGLWVGVLMQTFIFDRGKRVAKSTAVQWYLSKTVLMMLTVFVQATLEIWLAYAVGWHMLGLVTMFYIWLWFIASGFLFVIIIQALWFIVKDESIGKFMTVIVMVLSLAAGGGTFPAFAQFAFFHYISYLVPFTYVIRGFTAITFGTSLADPTTLATQLYILKNFAIFFIYIGIFVSLGLIIGSKNRLRDMNYGAHSAKKVLIAMTALSRDTSNFASLKTSKFARKPKYKYSWKALPKTFDQELYMKCRELFPFEGEFKWHKNKSHDFVQKPNYSDEDQITRNE